MIFPWNAADSPATNAPLRTSVDMFVNRAGATRSASANVAYGSRPSRVWPYLLNAATASTGVTRTPRESHAETNAAGSTVPVRSPRGVVGRILETGSSSSRVLLLTDTESVLPVRRAGDEVVAFAEGRGDGLLRIKLINLGINPLEPGDLFVTSGAGGYYPPGIAVAILTETTDDGGLARIVSDPAAADYVSVEQIYEPEAALGAETPIERELTD